MQIGVDQQGGLNGAWKLAVREELGMSLDCAPASLSLSLSSSLSESLSHCPPILVTLSSLSHCHPCHTPCRSPCHTCSRTPCHKSSLSHCLSCHITCHSACQIVLFVPHASFPKSRFTFESSPLHPVHLQPCMPHCQLWEKEKRSVSQQKLTSADPTLWCYNFGTPQAQVTATCLTSLHPVASPWKSIYWLSYVPMPYYWSVNF